MIENYLTYIKFIDAKLEKFFNKQKPYIFCKKGCGKCCKNAQFPYSLVETIYLMQGYLKLDKNIRDKIEQNFQDVIEKKRKFNGEKFLYDCPFLVNDECALYEYRGIVCRSFGLMSVDENGKIKVPFCYSKGLNYSNVMDDDGKQISVAKFKKLHIEEVPLAFNITYEFLTDSDFERGFNFKFGDKKPLIDWLIMDNLEKEKNI